MKSKIGRPILIVVAAALIGLPLQAAAAKNMDPSSDTSSGRMGKTNNAMENRSAAEQTVLKAAQVFKAATMNPDQAIPASVVDSAAGIAIFPGMIKAALVAGGSHGTGVMMARQVSGQWSPPLFVSTSGGSLGAQVGVESTDLILVFRSPSILEKVASGKGFTLGVDASVAAGDIGKSASVSTKDAQILTYKYSSGVFAGAALTGSKLKIDEEPTIAYYRLPQAEKSARGYYRNEQDLYNQIIGSGTMSESGMKEQHPQALQQIPDSATALQRTIKDYASSAMDTK